MMINRNLPSYFNRSAEMVNPERPDQIFEFHISDSAKEAYMYQDIRNVSLDYDNIDELLAKYESLGYIITWKGNTNG